ncbi:MAG TPA: hypothetical protein VMA75_02430 [Candidatus Paceibacterota bacterium]|nr:hypothetical protein [Candidatus Paceibacterota bacterium]
MNIEWNRVTWYSKFIALILFVALPFIGFYYGMHYGELIGQAGQAPAITPVSTTTASSYYSDPAEWQTDANNTQGGFSIAYPLDFAAQDNYSVTPSTDWRLGSNGEPGIKYFTLTVPDAFEPQTNFIDATLTVGASANNTAIAQCMAPDAGDGSAMTTSSATMNGINFTVVRSSGAGAGNLYDTTSYRTLHAGECYAVEYTVHSGQIANYPSSYNLQQFDGQKVDALMDAIVGTFKFL